MTLPRRSRNGKPENTEEKRKESSNDWWTSNKFAQFVKMPKQAFATAPGDAPPGLPLGMIPDLSTTGRGTGK